MLLQRDRELKRDSCLEASVTRPAPAAALAGHRRVDVGVVGGGLAGLSAALDLAQRGYSVLLAEAQAIGSGASGRSGGQIIAGFGDAGDDAIADRLGATGARMAWDIAQQGMTLVNERIAQHAIACDYVAGHLVLARDARRARALRARCERLARDFAYRLRWIDADEIGDWIASRRYCAGVFDARAGHLHPLKYALGLAAAARSAGVEICENSPVVALERGARPRLRSAHGDVECRFVVLAGNAYLGHYGSRLAPELTPRIVALATYTLATAPLAPQCAATLIRGRAAAHDNNHLLDYFRVSADDRLLFGGADSAFATSPQRQIGALTRRMLAVFPQLDGVAVDHAWGGLVDVTTAQTPDFGRLGSNVYYLQGFCGHGLALSAIAGRLVALAIAGQSERLDLFARLRPRALPGGPRMHAALLALALAYYRLLDWI